MTYTQTSSNYRSGISYRIGNKEGFTLMITCRQSPACWLHKTAFADAYQSLFDAQTD